MTKINFKGVPALLEQQRKAWLDTVTANAARAAMEMRGLGMLGQAHLDYKREQDEQVARLLADKSK